MLLKLRSMGIDLQNRGLLWWALGASWICIPLFNSNFLESRHPLSSHLCVYSDTQSLALWNQSSWLMMRMWVCVTCMSCAEGVNVSFAWRAFCITHSVCDFQCVLDRPDCQRKHIGADWHSYLLLYPVWALAAEGSIGRQWRSAEPPLLLSCENDRPTQKAVQASQPQANSITD